MSPILIDKSNCPLYGRFAAEPSGLRFCGESSPDLKNVLRAVKGNHRKKMLSLLSSNKISPETRLEKARFVNRLVNELALDMESTFDHLSSLVQKLSLAELKLAESVFKELNTIPEIADMKSSFAYETFFSALITLMASGKLPVASALSLPKQYQAFFPDHSDFNPFWIVSKLASYLARGINTDLRDSEKAPQFTELSLSEAISHAERTLQKVENLKAKGTRILPLTCYLLEKSETLNQFTAQVRILKERLESGYPLSPQTVMNVYSNTRSFKGVGTILKILQEFKTHGGDAEKLSKFLPDLPIDESRLKGEFEGIGKIWQQYQSPRERKAFWKTFKIFWDKSHQTPRFNFITGIDILTRASLAIPDNVLRTEGDYYNFLNALQFNAVRTPLQKRILPDPHAGKDVYRTEAEFRAVPEKLRQIFSDNRLPKEDLQPLAKLYMRCGNLETVGLAKRMMVLLLANRQLTSEKNEEQNPLSFILRNLSTGYSNEIRPNTFVTAMKSMKGIEEKIIQDKKHIKNLETALERGLDLMSHRAFKPEQLGEYVEVLVDIAATMPEEMAADNMRDPSLFGDYFGPDSPLNDLNRLRHTRDLFQTCRQELKNPQAMNFILQAVRLVLNETEESQWPRIMAEFPQFLNRLSDKVVNTFGLNNDALSGFLYTAADVVKKKSCRLGLAQVLTLELNARKSLRKIITDPVNRDLLVKILTRNSSGSTGFLKNLACLERLLTGSRNPEDIASMIRIFCGNKAGALVQPLVEDWLKNCTDPVPLLLSLYQIRKIPELNKKNLPVYVSAVLDAVKSRPEPEFLSLLPSRVDYFSNSVPESPRYFKTAMAVLSAEPGGWDSLAGRLSDAGEVLLEQFDASEEAGFYEKLQDTLYRIPESDLKINLETMAAFANPTRLLNHVMLNREFLLPEMLHILYTVVDQEDPSLGKPKLPELMALVTPYAEMVREHVPELQDSMLNAASEGLTHLYNYINSEEVVPGIETGRIDQIQGIVLNNWAKIGTLGLSFTKWQYDAMARWKGMGPSQKPSLLEQSGRFKAIPPRENDKTYHRGFVNYDPNTQLSIEFRRAYIVISKPGLGTLVIRNSSPVFGRDLLEEPAYYHPDKTYTQGENLFNPDTDLKDPDFQGVFSKRMHITRDAQLENHEKIDALLNALDESMEPYIAWKCGFKDGKPPEGFKEFLQSALLSAKNDGAMTPFGKKKSIKLSWVNRFGLPMPVETLSLSTPGVQTEVENYLAVLNRQRAIPSPEEYQRQMPKLLEFLKAGLSQNLELVLSE